MVKLIFQRKKLKKHFSINFYLYVFLSTGYYQNNKENLQKEAREKDQNLSEEEKKKKRKKSRER